MLTKKAKLHLYDKKESRVGRKMGHITAIATTVEEAVELAEDAANNFKW
jgi:5-(carboxyamino)imidazole ribonucleotide synthase